MLSQEMKDRMRQLEADWWDLEDPQVNIEEYIIEKILEEKKTEIQNKLDSLDDFSGHPEYHLGARRAYNASIDILLN